VSAFFCASPIEKKYETMKHVSPSSSDVLGVSVAEDFFSQHQLASLLSSIHEGPELQGIQMFGSQIGFKAFGTSSV